MIKPRKFSDLRGPEGVFKKAYNDLVDYVLATAPANTPDSFVSHTTGGAHVKPRATRRAAGGLDMVFRGEWSEDMGDILAGHCVVVRGGTNMGSYIAVVDDPEGDPWDSEDWLQFPSTNTIGKWT